MYTKGKRKGTFTFKVKTPNGARQVVLVGDFNGWTPVAMKKQKDGSFAATVQAPPGACQYKFIIDGQWRTDPDHSHWARNPYGSMNSVAHLA